MYWSVCIEVILWLLHKSEWTEAILLNDKKSNDTSQVSSHCRQ